ncbi:uncharacterized protein C11orf87 homolog [Hoplias malabaricus]|uniref:uncharacterized protein C11orf87 homolog n=1 Tax=Hoplias malabaricus TaxID=27720 RepID=UPI003461DAC4
MPLSPLALSSGAAERVTVGFGLESNASCAEKVDHLPPPFSSTSALSLLGVVIVAIVALSLTTHRCHKGQMKRRKMERAQEEYERDHRSPTITTANAGAVAAEKQDPRRCTIIRPEPRPASSTKPRTDPQQPAPSAPAQTEDSERGNEAVLEAVAVS